MKPLRLLIALIGLVAIGLAYKTGNVDYLLIAVVAMFGGLYLMGALSRSRQVDDRDNKPSNKSTRGKNQNQK